jgi:hypothetical protein
MLFRVNIASNPLQTHRRFRVFSSATGTIAVIALLGLGWHVYAIRQANSIFRAERDAVSSETQLLTKQREELSRFFALPENAQLADRAALINGIIDQRSGYCFTLLMHQWPALLRCRHSRSNELN